MKYETYAPSRDVVDIQSNNGMTHTRANADGPWLNEKSHAIIQVELLMHHYPKMDRETQLRANRTMKELSDRYGL